jgi:hypothetical protein
MATLKRQSLLGRLVSGERRPRMSAIHLVSQPGFRNGSYYLKFIWWLQYHTVLARRHSWGLKEVVFKPVAEVSLRIIRGLTNINASMALITQVTVEQEDSQTPRFLMMAVVWPGQLNRGSATSAWFLRHAWNRSGSITSIPVPGSGTVVKLEIPLRGIEKRNKVLLVDDNRLMLEDAKPPRHTIFRSPAWPKMGWKLLARGASRTLS